jgi:hypothetical protein
MAKVPRDSVSPYININKKTNINQNKISSTPNLVAVHQVLSERKRKNEQSVFN